MADEAPNLIPGMPYKFRGDPELANALIESFGEAEIQLARNNLPHYACGATNHVGSNSASSGSQIEPGAC
ncbi:hypothetical protein [Polaromonas hydrogenivorans]|uniref:Uncharacterized protein n=1 Tax=Polaromonas hydrogenivorans TaxID=335476 RepID=A0AAU7M0D6_9BURK